MNRLVGTICLCASFAVILVEAYKLQNHPLEIYGGDDAKDGEFPYMVQLISGERFNYSYYCGATIIGDKWLLTSGYCVSQFQGLLNNSGGVIYGTNVLANLGRVNTTIKVKNSYLHPEYYQNKSYLYVLYYDVGIMELEHAIPFDAKAQPVQLADANAQVPYHKNGTLCGWGLPTFGEIYASNTLKKLTLQLLTDTECENIVNKYLHTDIFRSTHNLCTNDKLMTGMCGGDSGGGIVVDGVQYGIASWTYGCGYTSGVYSRLTTPSYREFIKNITGI